MSNETTPVELSAADFDAFIKGAEKPVLVDFWAEWCGPCRQMGPILSQIAAERDDVIIAKVNVDANGALASTFGINAIPAMLLFVNGERAASIVGARPKEQLIAQIQPYL